MLSIRKFKGFQKFTGIQTLIPAIFGTPVITGITNIIISHNHPV
jgi:hypothetical protein